MEQEEWELMMRKLAHEEQQFRLETKKESAKYDKQFNELNIEWMKLKVETEKLKKDMMKDQGVQYSMTQGVIRDYIAEMKKIGASPHIG